MKQKFITISLIFALFSANLLKADEGMWIPMLLKKYNIDEMKEKGFKLTAEDIYSINKASMKDAVMIFNGGCTAELISDEGLIITNHHCGYGAIQSHSTVEDDYLTNGYWAMSRSEELPNPGMSVTFLKRMEDVTSRVLEGVEPDMAEAERRDIVNKNIERVKREAIDGTHYGARVEPFYFGNQYFLFVNEKFKDIRLVGAPPSSVGKFGGDTDNWMWPRHTGDFSMFRIYANADNEPAKYSKDNVPYEPKKHFKISLKGYEKDDFTMVFGYPGSTDQYYTSWAVQMEAYDEYPHRINIRDKKLDIIKKAMKSDQKIRIQYASKQSRISNAWKKWQGIIRGLDRLNAIEKKESLQEQFTQWVDEKRKRRKQYGGLLDAYEGLYDKLSPYNLAAAYARECGFYLDPLSFAGSFMQLSRLKLMDENKKTATLEKLSRHADKFFKDYNRPTDKKVFASIMQLYADSMPKQYRPEAINKAMEKFNGDMQEYTDQVYQKSVVLKKDTIKTLLKSGTQEDINRILQDPVVGLYASLLELYTNELQPSMQQYQSKIDSLNRHWIRGLKTMQADKTFWPDANFTLRVAYGEVKGYKPRDAVNYKHYTTMKGIMEKNDPDVYDYDVPEKLINLYQNKQFGQYDENGEMHVCFIASNHTSGGNSGSPVINGNGELIGVNFDRNWEGTMSDIMYDPTQCRNITLDIRYALFIVDKYAGATHLIDEMDIVK